MTRPDVSTERSARIEARIRDALAALGPMPHFAWVRAELVEFRAGEGLAVLRLAGSCPDTGIGTRRGAGCGGAGSLTGGGGAGSTWAAGVGCQPTRKAIAAYPAT